jgi:hypothetical protein
MVRSRADALHVAAIGAVVLSLLVLCSCASARYERDWIFEGVALTDTLILFENAFLLERSSPLGVSNYSGRLFVDDDEWRFEIETWKPADGDVRHFDPPIVYVYRGRSFQNGIAFYSYKVIGRSPISLFIRAPTDFDLRD